MELVEQVKMLSEEIEKLKKEIQRLEDSLIRFDRLFVTGNVINASISGVAISPVLYTEEIEKLKKENQKLEDKTKKNEDKIVAIMSKMFGLVVGGDVCIDD